MARDKRRGMRFCVLGGGGSFGLHTSRHLLESGAERVIGIGRSPEKPECFSLNVGRGDRRYSYRSFHVTYELDLLLEYLDEEKPDVIVNFAAQGEGAVSFRHSWRFFETNCVGLVRLVEELGRRDYLQRFIHIGTSELYGSSDRPMHEDDPIRPTSPYAASKAAFDLHLMAVHRTLGFPVNIIRPSNAYGEGQQLHRLIPRAMLAGLAGDKLPLQGGGVAEKSYIHSADLAAAIHIVALKASLGGIYNVGPDQPTSIRSVVEMIADTLCLRFDDLAEVTADRQHQDARYWLDSSRIRLLGWKPAVTWADGLSRVANWARHYFEALRAQPVEFTMRG